MRIDVARLIIEADSAGRITSVAPRRRPERPFLAAVEIGTCRRGGADVSWIEQAVEVDADELALHLVAAGLEVTLRHSFSTGWTTRLLIVNTDSAEARLDRISLIVRPTDGHRVSAQAAGSRLCWAVQPVDGDGPLLAARLAAGVVDRVTDETLELGPLRLAAGQRYVAQLRWELFATPRSVVIGPGRDVLVERTTYEVGETALLPADPDAALVTPPGIGVDLVEEAEHAGREVFALEPGRHRVELRSADGDVRLDLRWVRPLPEQLAQWSADVLAGPRTSAGIVALEALPDALVLQAALGAGDVDDVDQAGDALDRLTARLIDGASSEEGVRLRVLWRCCTCSVSTVAPATTTSWRSRWTRKICCWPRTGPSPAGLGLAVLRTVLALGSAGGQERLAPLLLRAVQRLERLPVDDVDGSGGGARAAARRSPVAARRPPGPAAGAPARPSARCCPR